MIRASKSSSAPLRAKTILATNNGVKPFDDLRVRKALAYAINRQSLIDGAMFGYGTLIGLTFRTT